MSPSIPVEPLNPNFEMQNLTLISLAPELLYHILGLCSPSDLASLSQVNSVLQHASEYFIYRHIYTFFFPFDLVSKNKKSRSCDLISEKNLIYTLAVHSKKKAALVRKLHVQFEHTGPFDPSGANKEILGKIADVLDHADKLEDLRLMVDQTRGYFDVSEGRLSQAISQGPFRLHTLYCDQFQEFESIIASQTSLRILGIYVPRLEFEVTERLSALYETISVEDKPKLPIIFMLETPPVNCYISSLMFAPAFYMPGQAATVCKEVANSLAGDVGRRYPLTPKQVPSISLCLNNISDENADLVYEMMEVISEYFPNCTRYDMTTTNLKMKPWRFPGFVSSLRLLKLERLSFSISAISEGKDSANSSSASLLTLAADLRMFLREELETACPTLNEVTIKNEDQHAQLYRQSGWFIAMAENHLGTWVVDDDGTTDGEYEDEEEEEEEEGGEGGEEGDAGIEVVRGDGVVQVLRRR